MRCLCLVVVTLAIASVLGCQDSERESGAINKSDVPTVSNVRLNPSEEPDHNVLMRWSNPDFEGFENVKVSRSSDSFPENPNDGDSIYEGTEQRHEDRENVVPGTVYYYSFFVFDSDGNHSKSVQEQTRVPNGSGRR